MPYLIGALVGAILRAIPYAVAQILISLGISAVTYVGVDMAIDHFKADALSYLHALPPEVLSLVAYMKVGQCLNIVFSAMVARMAYNGMKSGAVKQLSRR